MRISYLETMSMRVNTDSRSSQAQRCHWPSGALSSFSRYHRSAVDDLDHSQTAMSKQADSRQVPLTDNLGQKPHLVQNTRSVVGGNIQNRDLSHLRSQRRTDVNLSHHIQIPERKGH